MVGWVLISPRFCRTPIYSIVFRADAQHGTVCNDPSAIINNSSSNWIVRDRPPLTFWLIVDRFARIVCSPCNTGFDTAQRHTRNHYRRCCWSICTQFRGNITRASPSYSAVRLRVDFFSQRILQKMNRKNARLAAGKQRFYDIRIADDVSCQASLLCYSMRFRFRGLHHNTFVVSP